MRTIDGKEVGADYSTRLNINTTVAHRIPSGDFKGDTQYEHRKATVSDAFAILFDAVNGPDAVVAQVAREVFACEHRTLQQAFVRAVIVPILDALVEAGEKNYFDARNEASVKFAQNALADYGYVEERKGKRRRVVPLPTI